MANHIKKQLQQFKIIEHDRKIDLSRYSHARVGLGHTGGHLKWRDWLLFQVAFAQAKDALFSQFVSSKLFAVCDELHLRYLEIQSQAENFTQFLLRPDLGQLIAADSVSQLERFIKKDANTLQPDLLIIISGGLSPIAIEKQVPPFLTHFIQKIKIKNWSLAPIILNNRGRVALGDQINQYFKAKITIMLIGERPGLSTPDSLGIYFTYAAKPGCTNEQRNCISNIHEQGLSHERAAEKLTYLIEKALQAEVTGIALKDDFAKLPKIS